MKITATFPMKEVVLFSHFNAWYTQMVCPEVSYKKWRLLNSVEDKTWFVFIDVWCRPLSNYSCIKIRTYFKGLKISFLVDSVMCSDKCLAITHIEMHHSSITLIVTDYILSFKSKKKKTLKYKHHTNPPPVPRGFY